MKETPQELKIHNNMKKGMISVTGFLGDDERHYHEIIADDKKNLEKIGLSADKIADRLEYFSRKAFPVYDGTTIIDEIYQVEYRSYRGRIMCPFGHGGGYRKGEITLVNLQNNARLCWTPLNEHMIRTHCFFEGVGSNHRLDPEIIKKALF
ncbi:MAG: hypothetical protein JW784_01600 [Candidatus Cloacimonetes bacterium]|nr:hypothetical protein [Candidatus Cloacimonadota bacterium]